MQFLDFEVIPSVSFRYAGVSSEEFFEEWPCEESVEETATGSVTHATRTDPATGLNVTTCIRRIQDSPAVDWVVTFENGGNEATPIIEDVLPLDLRVPMPPRERLRLHHAKGSNCQMDDFLPLTSDVPPGSDQTLAPLGGRSSNGTLPFMNLQRDGCGVVVGIGWSGQWCARLERDEQTLRLTAGMARTHLCLQSGEKIRTPRMLLLPWEGEDPTAGNNSLRQLLIAHYLPRIDGELVMPPAAQCLQAYFYLTDKASHKLEMAALPKVAAIGAEAYWIDACWYGDRGEWWEEVGSWTVNREKFPDGLKPISDAAHEAGMEFVLWFEPERVRAGSRLHREHPEFLLASQEDPSNLLLDMGKPEARQHITDLISELITENGVDIYREDFNFDPLPYWQAVDEPDRIGVTEIRYVEGHYAFWDELRRRHPSLWIDNCASGGRRIDLETLSRSLPLWPSDFPDICGLPSGLGLHVGDQCINAGLARWVPLFGGGVWNFTPYGTRGEIIGGFTFGFHIEHEDFPDDNLRSIKSPHDVMAKGKTIFMDGFPLADAQEAIAEWQSIRQFYLGDFYLLLPLTVAYHDWCAWQFHREDLNAGVAMFFRRHRSPFPSMEIGLKRIVPEATYDVSLSETYEESPPVRMPGAQLARMNIQIENPPGSLLLRYNRVD
jgi:alpha-galactosidase